MNDRPTPETETLYSRLLAENPGNLIYLEEMLSHARRLERERDEWAAMCGQYKQERDDAREALASREVVIAQQNVITDLMLERDEAIRLLKLCADYSLTTHQEQVEEFLKKIK